MGLLMRDIVTGPACFARLVGTGHGLESDLALFRADGWDETNEDALVQSAGTADASRTDVLVSLETACGVAPPSGSEPNLARRRLLRSDPLEHPIHQHQGAAS